MSAVQAVALVFLGTHAPALQKLPLPHWVSVVQEVGQLAEEPLHT